MYQIRFGQMFSPTPLFVFLFLFYQKSKNFLFHKVQFNNCFLYGSAAFIDLNIRTNRHTHTHTQKKKIQKNLINLRLVKEHINRTQRVWTIKKTVVKLDFMKKEIFALLIKKEKAGKSRSWRKHLPKTYLIKNLYPEYLQLN